MLSTRSLLGAVALAVAVAEAEAVASATGAEGAGAVAVAKAVRMEDAALREEEDELCASVEDAAVAVEEAAGVTVGAATRSISSASGSSRNASDLTLRVPQCRHSMQLCSSPPKYSSADMSIGGAAPEDEAEEEAGAARGDAPEVDGGGTSCTEREETASCTLFAASTAARTGAGGVC